MLDCYTLGRGTKVPPTTPSYYIWRLFAYILYMTTVWNKAHKESFSVSMNRPSVPSLVPIITENFESEDQVDNIKDLGLPEEAANIEIEKPVEETDTQPNDNRIDDDMSLLKIILVSLVSVLLTLHVTYTWYYNFTQCAKEATFYKTFDFLKPFEFITGYFTNIIMFIDIAINEKFKNLNITGQKLFILLLLVSGGIVAYIFNFIYTVYSLSTAKKFNMKKLGPYSAIALLYFGCVIYGLYQTYKLAPIAVSSPLYVLIGTIILAAILFVPTTVAVMIVLFAYTIYYSIIGGTANPDSMYAKIFDGSFLGHYRALHSIMNANHVVYEMQDDATIKNFIESMLRGFFKYLPYIFLISGLASSLIMSINFNMAYLKYPFVGVTLISIISVIWLAIQENPKLLILFNTLKA
jgi:hypothetical protein